MLLCGTFPAVLPLEDDPKGAEMICYKDDADNVGTQRPACYNGRLNMKDTYLL